jgi:hypothetical protein
MERFARRALWRRNRGKARRRLKATGRRHVSDRASPLFHPSDAACV